ncbi:unnamed protein product, partial [Brenthis ino]
MKPKSDVQRSKEYRERQKLKRQIELQQKNIDRLQTTSTKTRAEYMKEYRRRVKLKNQNVQLNILLAKHHSDAKSTQGSTSVAISKRKSNAQKCKEYREKKKLNTPKQKRTAKSRAQINKNYYEKNKISNTWNKTRAEYMKEYRRRVKLKNQNVQLNVLLAKHHSDAEEKHKELKKELKRKRHCERQRAYYHRQKKLKKNEGKKKVPKTNAERQREFRQRKAEKSYVVR